MLKTGFIKDNKSCPGLGHLKKQNAKAYAFINLNNLEIFLEAVFLWIMPFLAAL
jgi:hypothetical protein